MIPDPHNQRSRYRRDATRPLERWTLNFGQSESSRTLRPGAPKTWNVDKMGDEASEIRQVERMYLLRGLQTLYDTAEADILSRRLNEEYRVWEDDEDPIREAVDSWDDEYGPDNRRLRWRYKTPTPHTPRLDAQAQVIRNLQALWVDTDIELQSRGWSPVTQDVNEHDRGRGKTPAPVQRSAGSGQIREAFPELFAGSGMIAPVRTTKPTDPWLDVLFGQIKGRKRPG